MALIGLNAILFRTEKIFLVVESRDSPLESSVPSSELPWCFWDVLATSARLCLIEIKLAFMLSLAPLHFGVGTSSWSGTWNLLQGMNFASSNFVGSPYSHLPRHTERCWQSPHHPISLAFWWKTKKACKTLLLLQGHLQMILLPPAFEIPTLYRGLNSNGWPYGIWSLQLSDRKIPSLLGGLKIHSA